MAIEGFITNLEFSPSGMPKLKERHIPLTRWFIVVILFYSSSLLNNIAFGYDIPMILHIVFRSASLFANMFMGWLILKKR
jgi:UDP-xylose/UDP-N-acetylglucosamine transporter B4